MLTKAYDRASLFDFIKTFLSRRKPGSSNVFYQRVVDNNVAWYGQE